MKLLLTIALILFSFASYSQDEQITFRCYLVQTGVWNKYSKEIDYGEKKKADYEVVLYKGAFRFENKSGSIYILKNQKEKQETYSDRTITVWNAIDEEGIACDVQIIKFKKSGSVQIQCFYTDMIIFFHLSPPL